MKALNPLLLLAASLVAVPAVAETVLIRDATVHTMSGEGVLENTDILVSGNVIRKIGRDLPVPADIRVFDAAGRPVTPGLFAGITAIGIGEVPGVPESMDAASALPEMRPEFDVTLAFNPNSSVIPVSRVEGLTFTLLGASGADEGGTILMGRGRVVALDGGYDSFAGPYTLFLNVGRDASGQSGGSRAAQWMLLSQLAGEARDAPRDGEQRLLTRDGRAVMQDFADGGIVVFEVDRASDILQAIGFAQRNGYRPVIAGGAQAWMVADRLAAAKVPVLLDPLDNLPGNFDEVGARLDNAALLHAAGVSVVIDGGESHNARKQRQRAGNAVANGLPHEAALAALTVNPARVFGVADRFGTLEEGKRADLVLWSGDPLEVTTVAELVIVNGEVDSMRSRQTELLQRYLPENPELPRAYINP